MAFNKKRSKFLNSVLLLSVFTLFSCDGQGQNKSEMSRDDNHGVTVSSEEVSYRPNFHFSPQKNWMNDPNGMFFYNDTYHLYFQHYPDGNVWGPMHWGHATSADMIKWEEQPIALYPDELGYIFSGSAVVDINNTSGFGKGGLVPIVALYTYHDPNGESAGRIDYQSQGIAYSLDEGMTWTKYDLNPVISNPDMKNFRDPKVIWDAQHNQWVMALAAGDKIMFYSSSDLINWDLLSTFGETIGAHGGVWECPDLIYIEVEGSDEGKWVLLVSINPGGPNGGTATQYFVGDFDGTNFTLDDGFAATLGENESTWIDLGKDNYAGVTWSNIPDTDGRTLFMGWMANWQYGEKVPTEGWRSSMTAAREMRLLKTEKSYRLAFTPVREFDDYKRLKDQHDHIVVGGEYKVTGSDVTDLSRSAVNFTVSDIHNNPFKMTLSNSVGEFVDFGYDAVENGFYVDRKNSGIIDFSNDFAQKISNAPRISKKSNLAVSLLIDKTSIEIFYDDGETVMTEIFFPTAPFDTLSIHAENHELSVENLDVYELDVN